MQRTPSFDEHKAKHECIPVGCIPPKVSRGICRERGGGVLCQACPPATHTPPCHTCPLPCMPPAMHAPRHICPTCHACPPATHATLPCMPPCHISPCHGCPPKTPLPVGQNSPHTLLKYLPCPNFVAGGNKRHFLGHKPHQIVRTRLNANTSSNKCVSDDYSFGTISRHKH